MRKYTRLILPLVILSVFFISCNDGVSYADRLKAERKQIKNFINENDFDVIEGFPSDSVFEKGVFYKDSGTGIYMCINDYGDKTKMADGSRFSEVRMRFKRSRILSDTVYVSYNTSQPMLIRYGDQSSYVSTNVSGFDAVYKSSACAMPLQYVGLNAKVSLIVPFNYGSTYQSTTYEPLYIEDLTYTEIWPVKQ